MTEPTCEFGGVVVLCEDCGRQLSEKELEHGLEGFGHYRRCCDCYDKRMGKR